PNGVELSPHLRHRNQLADAASLSHGLVMFVATDADAATIRTAFDQGGEFLAAVELRRRFSGIPDNASARDFARTIAGWKPLPLRKTRHMASAHQRGRRATPPVKPLQAVRWFQAHVVAAADIGQRRRRRRGA